MASSSSSPSYITTSYLRRKMVLWKMASSSSSPSYIKTSYIIWKTENNPLKSILHNPTLHKHLTSNKKGLSQSSNPYLTHLSHLRDVKDAFHYWYANGRSQDLFSFPQSHISSLTSHISSFTSPYQPTSS
jgi:hypothetical protein